MLKNISPTDSLTRLGIAHSVQDVAFALDLDPAKFFYVVQNTETGIYYHTFSIPKRRGGDRTISRPLRGLALAQQNLSQVLGAKYQPKKYVKGYVSRESFLTNARYHERQRWILNIDIESFFDSISFPRVFGLFRSEYFGFNPRVSAILARITTFQNGLPQGAPTSPIISNIIAYGLDRQLVSLAARHRLKYTRYADDITFSSSQRRPPSDIITGWEPKYGERIVDLGNPLRAAFQGAGFIVNRDKTRLQFHYERQEVTGLIVNKKANLWRKDISKFRMKMYSAKKFGASSAARVWLGKSATEGDFWKYVEGWLAFVRQVRGHDDDDLAKLCRLAVEAGYRGIEWIGSRRSEMPLVF